MKKINKIWFLGLAFILALASCDKEETQIVLNPGAKLEATLSATTLTLLKDNPDVDVLTVSWIKPDFGFPAAASYSVIIDKKGNNFAKPVTIGVGAALKKTFKKVELNTLVINLGIPAGTAADLDFKVDCSIGANTHLTTAIQNVKVTTYVDKLDLSSPWGVVGDATTNGWNGPDQPMYKSGTTNGLVGYVTVNDGQIKFRRNNDWGVNLGSAGSVEPDVAPSGSLKADGKNLGIKKGSYKISIDTVALTYKVEALTWGIVGDATTNGWNGPDMPMRYDPTVDLWRAEVKLVAGNIKFRLNNDWGTNYGGSNGTMALNGDNIAITPGTYLITADFKTLKYTITAYKPIGIIGDATPNGWGSTNDPKFTYNLSTKKWVLNNITLTAAQIKFRENDDWGNNWGSTGSVEPDPIGASGGLKAGGKNFGVTAGTWSFELDFTDSANPKYKATKK